MSEAMERAMQAALALTPAEWLRVSRDVNDEFLRRHLERRDREARELAGTMDMTPEGYVREWHARGRPQVRPLLAWEWAYQDAGVIERAERLGYIEIGRAASCPVTLTETGEALLPSSGGPAAP